ncbi:MAG: hypothetical protein ACT4TC_06145 [Myxococcaceae bacterium]
MPHNGEKSAAFSDTPASVTARLVDRARSMTEAERLLLAARFSSDIIRMSREGIRRAHPELSEDDARILFVELHYGRECAERMRRKRISRGL